MPHGHAATTPRGGTGRASALRRTFGDKVHRALRAMRRRSTGKRRRFRVLVASDGSPSADAAVRMACTFPWPAGARIQAVVAALPEWVGAKSPRVKAAFARGFERIAGTLSRRLRRQCPAAEVALVSETPVDAILHQARRLSADVIVVGWRGHGSVRRLLMGSVSRAVVERARGGVLVVRRTRPIRRALIGVDGSPNARRAVEFAARLPGERMAGVTLVRVVEPITLPTAGLLPKAVRATLARNAAMVNEQRLRLARRDVEAAAARLERAKWRVRTDVRHGTALTALLEAVDRTGADLLIVGAQGARDLRKVLLGSVAAGVLNRSPVPVLVVR
jgi:nucleotide-binding universal stress UspA family protein